MGEPARLGVIQTEDGRAVLLMLPIEARPDGLHRDEPGTQY